MHIARNSLDHGIESEERRTTAGKPLKGTIRLSAHQVGGRVMVEIADDGGGLNKERILARAIERKLIPNNRDPNSLSDREINQFIFANGFSTAEKITDVSGRGVGMDVVKTNVEKLKGTIEIQTQSGIGTTIIISIPLTTAISDAMIVTVRGQTYILAMDLIVELLNMNEQGLTSLEGGLEVLNHRGKSIPIINLSDILPEPPFMAPSDSPPPTVKSNLVALVQVGDQLTGLRLEKVLGQTQVVLKPLGENFKPDIGISGAAILGDGKVGLVIDPFSLKTVYKNRVAITENEAA
jgi:two-component system chemotaxis sensor kinase CheA